MSTLRNDAVVRDARVADFERINQIYNRTIVDNHVSFDTEPWNVHRRQQWWEQRDSRLDVLVLELAEEVVGISYSSWYRPKVAYRSSVETTIVLAPEARGRGLGTVLLGALIDRLRDRGFHRAVAIVTLPNEASIALHHKLGYRTVGTLTEVGDKLGRHWDTALLELAL